MNNDTTVADAAEQEMDKLWEELRKLSQCNPAELKEPVTHLAEMFDVATKLSLLRGLDEADTEIRLRLIEMVMISTDLAVEIATLKLAAELRKL